MGGLFDQPQNAAPQAIPGFEFLAPLLEQLAGALQGGTNNFASLFEGAGPQQGQLQGLFDQLGATVGQGFGALGEGLQTGFAPQAFQQVQQLLQPAADFAFQQGSADVAEKASIFNTLPSSGTNLNLAQLSGQIQSSLGDNLANFAGQSALQGQQIQGQLAGQAIPGLFGALAGQGNVQQQFPLQVLQALTQGAGQTPNFQPTFGTSKGESLLGAGTQLGSAALTSKA